MIEVTDLAVEKLNEYFQKNNLSSPLRVTLMQGGCSGPALALALDEKKDDDMVTTRENLTLLIEKNLVSQCGTVKVDFLENGDRSGFSISSANPIPGSGAGCNPGSCGSGGCGC